MKHLKRKITEQYKKIPKTLLKRSGVFLIILFFSMTMILQKDTTEAQFQFVWNMDETLVHNAANTQWDFLFEDEWWQEIYQWTLTGNTTIPTNNEWLIDSQEIENIINDLQWQTGENNTGTIYTGTITTWIQTKTGNIPTSLNCTTPRGEKVKNKDFVLAYQQRKDVNTICNIEKRVCISWELLWSFTQFSCKEDVVYNYKKVEVISYNKKVLNEYIQPVPPAYAWADFDTEGKINTEENPTNERWTTNNPVTGTPSVNQTPLGQKASCTTPRGQSIEHGQFIKAYKTSRGFIDMPCEVELRACVDGALKWSLNYSKCTFNNTTYADYLTAGSPTSNTGFLFFERIKNLFN